MDIVTHGLMGAILASPLFPTHPLSAAAFAFGNVLPDLDSLSRCAGKRAFLATHQGPTHAYASALVAGLGLDLALRLGAPGWHEPLAGPALALGMGLHSTLDYTNTFGIQLFAPFSRQRRACEWVFFIDAVVLLLSALALAGIVAAAHSGWRGAMGGVLENTVAAMEAQGARRENIHAALGPCIRQPSYEVGQDMKDTFAVLHDDHDKYFAPGARAKHYQFDLGGFVMDRLAGLGLASTFDVGLDTYPDAERFFSYRRTTHRGESDYGRALAAIALTGE